MFQRRSFAALVLLACLLNGTPYLMGRVGLIDPTSYKAARQRFCPSSGPPGGLVSACAPVLPAAALEHQDGDGFERLNLKRLYAPPGYWRLPKALDLLLLFGCPLLLLWGMVKGRWSWPGWQPLLPALPLLSSSALALLVALLRAPTSALLFSLRSMAWLPLLVLSGPASKPAVLAQLARAMAMLIILQIPLMLVEAIWGLPMSFGPPAAQLAQASMGLPTRLVGTFILPNILGIAVVCLLGFCMAYWPQRRALMPLSMAALPIVMLARSGTGLLVWVLLMAFWANRAWRPHPAMKLIGLMLIAAIVLALPSLLGRSDLWQSILTRVNHFRYDLDAQFMYSNQLLFGQGLLHGRPTESFPAQLLLQGGLLALVGFYGLLVWAWLHDPKARPFLLAVSLSSLTLPIGQLFPINFLLALSINRSMALVSLSKKSS